MDHIDGDADNNRRENLRLICPNCDRRQRYAAGLRGTSLSGRAFGHPLPDERVSAGECQRRCPQ
nr:HNH endonuclease [Mycobacterium sp. IDR2000157661]